MYSLLGIKGIRTTPYHPHTDGLVERYNQTLKSMLRKFVAVNGKDWDPQASTSFSPFELLYGRQVRGPLDVLREAWAGPETPMTQSLVAHVLEMRNKMEEMTELVWTNMEQAQSQQKTWYDKSARQRILQPGQKVLLLLPTSENKLLARWQGPYEVVWKMGPVTYKIDLPGRRKPRQTFHVNFLKEWHREANGTAAQGAGCGRGGGGSVSPDLLPAEGEFCLLAFSKKGWGSLKDITPVRKRMYRVPERLLPCLKAEVEMLALGVIERSSSEWSNPVVLVPKKDCTMHFCFDFRQVNAQSHFARATGRCPWPRRPDIAQPFGPHRGFSSF